MSRPTTPIHAAYKLHRPAGFWIRAVAFLIDGLVLSPVVVLSFAVSLHFKSLPLILLLAIPGMIYKPVMESRYGATLGKMACGVRVIDQHGERLSLGAAYIRFAPWLAQLAVGVGGTVWLYSNPKFQAVSSFMGLGKLAIQSPFSLLDTVLNWVVLIDCATAAFTDYKRAVHDMMANSYCVEESGTSHGSRCRSRVDFSTRIDSSAAPSLKVPGEVSEQAQPPIMASDPFKFEAPTRPSPRPKPHRGSAVLAIGILSIFPFPPLGIVALAMASSDLEAMRKHRMDRSGEGITRAGQVLGIVSTALMVVGVFVLILTSH